MITVNITGHDCLFEDTDYEMLSKLGGMSVCTKPDGYKTIVFSSGIHVTKYVHRILLDAKKNEEVDHKDGNTLNGLRDNIRLATSQQNKFNTIRPKKSGLPRGVMKHGKNYKAVIRWNYITYYLGTYMTVEEAAEVYRKKADEFQKEFALHNSRPSE